MSSIQRGVLSAAVVLAIIVGFLFPPKVVHFPNGIVMTPAACRASGERAADCAHLSTVDGAVLLGRLVALGIIGGAAFLLTGNNPRP